MTARFLGWSALALVSLLVGAIALSPTTARPGWGGRAGRIALEMPTSIFAVAAFCGTLAAMALFAYSLALARLRGKEDDVKRAMRGILLLPLLIGAAAVWQDGSLHRFLIDRGPPPSERQEPLPSTDADAPPVAAPLLTAAISVVVIGASLASLALVVWIIFGERLAEWWRPPPEGGREPLAAAVDESLDDLRLEPDARTAIIRCYRRFEGVLARSRVRRAPWQTPLEFMRDALGRLPLPADAVRQLTSLFERARFSDEPMAPADRDVAWQALLAIRDRLEAQANVSVG